MSTPQWIWDTFLAAHEVWSELARRHSAEPDPNVRRAIAREMNRIMEELP